MREDRCDDPVGVIMLDTNFPRIPGDVGNPGTWPFPTETRVVPAATPALALGDAARNLLPAFIEAGNELAGAGAVLITTSCGFLSVLQSELAAALPVPVATSALMQVPLLDALSPPGKRAGILTISADALTADHLAVVGVRPDTPIATTEGREEFTRAILSDAEEFDVAAARRDNVEAARELVSKHPEVGAIVLECANMGPYARDIRNAVGVPVHSIVSFVCWLRSGVRPQKYSG